MGDTRGGGGGGGGGGWTVADTSTIRATRRSGGKGGSSSASAPSPVPGPAQQHHHHIRWSNDVLKETPEDPGGGGGDFSVASPAFRGADHPGDESESRETAKPKSSVLKKNTERGGEGEDHSLDKLLDGLTELSQTLPDLKRPDDVDTSSPLRFASDTPPTYNDAVSERRNVITENVDSLSKGLNSAADVIRAKTDSKSSSKGAGQSAKEYPSVRETKNALEGTCAPGRPGADEGRVDPSSLTQPYHMMEDSKPFSYIPMNNGGSRPGSRSSQRPRAGGLESPSLLRRIMGQGEEDEAQSEADFPPPPSSKESTPALNSNGAASAFNGDRGQAQAQAAHQLAELQQKQAQLLLEQQQQLLQRQHQLLQQQARLTPAPSAPSPTPSSVISPPSYTNYLLKKPGESDEEATVTWLERQQRKLQERREVERRRVQRNNTSNKFLMNELKSSLKPLPAVESPVSEVASEPPKPQPVNLDNMSTETLEKVYQQMVKMQLASSNTATTARMEERAFQTSTPRMPTQPNLSRQMSDASYDRVRPMVGRRLRYDSESETELGSFYYGGDGGGLMTHNGVAVGGGAGVGGGPIYGSSNSIDHLHLGSLPGSRPITPGFPTGAAPGVHHLHLRPPGGGGGYHLYARGLHEGGGRASPGAGSLYQSAPTPQRASSRAGSVSSEPADVAAHHVKMAKENYKFWYKPNISREEAIAVLKSGAPGAFIVRDSNSFPGAFGLALKVATPPATAKAGDDSDLVRHFLIEPTSKGVKLKGYANEPVFASLSALVYQHTMTQLALPVKLLLPTHDLSMISEGGSNRDSIDSRISTSSQMQQLLKLGAACNVLYLFSMDVDTLTGPSALKKTIGHLMDSRSVFRPVLAHFKVSSSGITLTDTARKVFFRRHYNTSAITFCGLDPADRRWKTRDTLSEDKMFGFVARKAKSRNHNQCHVFAEHDPEQPARAIVNFVNKVMMQNNNNNGLGSHRASVDVV